MKKSAAVTVGLVLVAGMSFACGTGEDEGVEADYQEICVERATLFRAEWERCYNDPSHISYYPFYMSRTHGAAPAVGSKVNLATGTTTRPASGSIARPPSSGGFGLHGGTVGG